MAKVKLQNTFSTDNSLFDDLEKYLQFCVEYGYPYNEATIYDQRSVACRHFNKWLNGKEPRNNWVEDAKTFAG